MKINSERDGSDAKQVPLRLSAELLDRIERHVLRMRREHPGVTVSRSDALRSLIAAALEAVETREAIAKPAP